MIVDGKKLTLNEKSTNLYLKEKERRESLALQKEIEKKRIAHLEKSKAEKAKEVKRVVNKGKGGKMEI